MILKLLRYLLVPFVPVYFLVTWFRNIFFRLGWFKQQSYDFPVICVGNLSVGGTGKTPMIEYLIRLLKDDFKVATLSRGYKRQTDGFQLANDQVNAKTIGDEPYQFYFKFGNEVQVAVDANRREGISKLQKSKQKPEVILLDDAFQHRNVKSGLNILLTTFSQPYFNDIVLPTGNLREPRKGAKRADIIIVTKCPENLTSDQKKGFIKRIQPKSYQQVFFSTIAYSEIVYSQNLQKPLERLEKFTLVTGIANPKPLIDFLNKKELKFEHLNFKDHHEFNAMEIAVLSEKQIILTTEKDYMRLKDIKGLENNLFYLPITVKIDKPVDFDKRVKSFVAG